MDKNTFLDALERDITVLCDEVPRHTLERITEIITDAVENVLPKNAAPATAPTCRRRKGL